MKDREIFEKLRQFNLKIEHDKCEFLKTKLNYLGHVVTSGGVKPDPQKVKAIKEFPTPENTTDVKSFLGLAGYYRKFIPQFSKMAKPLNDWLKKDNAWQLEQEQNYSRSEKELIAIVWACRHFRPYLLGRKFTIVTDHKPLTWMFSVKDPSSRLLRWRFLLKEFDYTIEYKAGKRTLMQTH